MEKRTEDDAPIDSDLGSDASMIDDFMLDPLPDIDPLALLPPMPDIDLGPLPDIDLGVLAG